MPVLPFLFLAGFLAGGAHGFLYPALSALLMDVTPERRRGSAVGIFSSVFLVGNAFGAIVFGYVAHRLGYAPMWGMLVALLTGGFAWSSSCPRSCRVASSALRATRANAGAELPRVREGGGGYCGTSPSRQAGRCDDSARHRVGGPVVMVETPRTRGMSPPGPAR